MMLFIESISYLSVLGAAVVGLGIALMISFGLAFLCHYFGASLETPLWIKVYNAFCYS